MCLVSRDTAGQERYQTITKQYYRRAQVTGRDSSLSDSAAGDTDVTHAHFTNIKKNHMDLQMTSIQLPQVLQS